MFEIRRRNLNHNRECERFDANQKKKEKWKEKKGKKFDANAIGESKSSQLRSMSGQKRLIICHNFFMIRIVCFSLICVCVCVYFFLCTLQDYEKNKVQHQIMFICCGWVHVYQEVLKFVHKTVWVMRKCARCTRRVHDIFK